MTPKTASAPKNRHSWFRPAWTPAMIGIMVLGFIIAWPVGLVLLAYIIWGDRLGDVKHGVKREYGRFKREMDMQGFNGGPRARETGNVAFDEFRKAEIERLEEERRKLDAMVDEFDEHLRNLRRAKDQAEFDEFMRTRQTKADAGPTIDGEAAPAT